MRRDVLLVLLTLILSLATVALSWVVKDYLLHRPIRACPELLPCPTCEAEEARALVEEAKALLAQIHAQQDPAKEIANCRPSLMGGTFVCIQTPNGWRWTALRP